MRIISNFKDYYDCMQGYGYDPYIVYNRKARPNLIQGTNYYTDFRHPYHGWSGINNVFEYTTHNIGFCGRYYLLIEVYSSSGSLVLQTYNIDGVDKFISDNTSKKEQKIYFGNTPKWEKKSYPIFTREHIAERIKKFQEEVLHDDRAFIRNNTPVIINHEIKRTPDNEAFWITTFDGCLADVSFYKVMEPWLAYQEIGMYLAGPLCTKYKKIPEIDDKTLAEAKGFDRFSFRRDPQVKNRDKSI